MPRSSQIISDPGSYRAYRYPGAIPGLTGAERQVLWETVLRIVVKNFNITKTWTQQDIHAEQAFMDEAMKSLPFLARYQHGWPAKALGQMILQRRDRLLSSSSPSHPVILIPPPPSTRSVRNVSQIPGLTDHERARFSRVMAEEAGTCFRRGMTWSRQADDAKEQFVKRMSERLTCLNRFVGAWPARYCIKRWLSNHRNDRYSPSRSPSVEIVSPAPQSIRRNTKPQIAPFVVSSGTAKSARECAVVQPDLTDDVRSILRDAGVKTADHFDTLANWSFSDQEAFIKDDLNLNKFQARMLRRALDARRESGSD